MISRSVLVNQDQTPIEYYDRLGNLQTLGTLNVHEYQGEHIRKFDMVPTENNPYLRSKKRDDKAEPIKLGKQVASDRFEIVQPATVQKIFIDRGLQIADQYGTNGGTEMVTLFRNPEMEMPNIFDYDRKLWQGRHDIANVMYHGIELRTSLEVGSMAMSAREGLYVLVCTNGLMADVMKLPVVKMQHFQFTIERAEKLIESAGFSSRGLDVVRGPQVANRDMLSHAYNAISRFRDSRDRDVNLSVKAESPFYSFDRKLVSMKLLNAYLEHLQGVINNDSSIVYAGDIVNAYTSAVNRTRSLQEDTLRGAYAGFSHTDSITTATANLAKLAGMFLDIDFTPVESEVDLNSLSVPENALAGLEY